MLVNNQFLLLWSQICASDVSNHTFSTTLFPCGNTILPYWWAASTKGHQGGWIRWGTCYHFHNHPQSVDWAVSVVRHDSNFLKGSNISHLLSSKTIRRLIKVNNNLMYLFDYRLFAMSMNCQPIGFAHSRTFPPTSTGFPVPPSPTCCPISKKPKQSWETTSPPHIRVHSHVNCSIIIIPPQPFNPNRWLSCGHMMLPSCGWFNVVWLPKTGRHLTDISEDV